MENRKIAEEIIRQLQLFSLSGAYGVLLYFFVLSRWFGKVLSYLVGFFCRIIKIARGIFGFPGKVIVKNTGKTLKNMRKTIKIIRNHK